MGHSRWILQTGGGVMLRYQISLNGKFCPTNAMVKRGFGVFAVKIVLQSYYNTEYMVRIGIYSTNSYPHKDRDTATLIQPSTFLSDPPISPSITQAVLN